jgi:hypothetical protein
MRTDDEVSYLDWLLMDGGQQGKEFGNGPDKSGNHRQSPEGSSSLPKVAPS